MDCLNWELTVLSRSVAYPNLSTAAMHVGLSQPQLSRIVARLEAELGLVLLDREAKRKSGWTAPAQRLADACARATRGLNADVHRLTESTEPRELRIGALEGLLPLASALARGLFEQTRVRTLDVDMLDLNPLEEQFLSGALDLLFTIREPGRRKFRNSLRVGYQALERVSPRDSGVEVLSPFEFRARPAQRTAGRMAGGRGDAGPRILVSNSLLVRREWIEQHGGRGTLPSAVRKARSSASEHGVFLIAHDHLSPNVWKTAVALAG